MPREGQFRTGSYYRKLAVLLLWDRDGSQCWECGRPMTLKDATIEHKVPVCQGGAIADTSNLALSHASCNGQRKKAPLAGKKMSDERWSLMMELGLPIQRLKDQE